MSSERRHVVVVLFTGGPVRRVNRFIEALRGGDVDVTVLSAEGGHAWPRDKGLDSRTARVLSIGRSENRQPLVWLYLAFVERGPGIVLGRGAERLPGVLGEACRRGASLHRRAARLVRRRLFWPVYKLFRGQALRRIARRRLDQLELERAERVIVVDDTAVPFGWMLTRRHPGLEVTRRLDRTVYEPR